MVFDKTGTMTQGVFEVSGVHHNEISDEKLLEYAALAECSSSHPISKSLQKAYGKPIDRNRVGFPMIKSTIGGIKASASAP